MTTYIIEIWDPSHNCYAAMWKGSSSEWAERTFNKPYYRRHTRRLARVTRTVIAKATKGEQGRIA